MRLYKLFCYAVVGMMVTCFFSMKRIYNSELPTPVNSAWRSGAQLSASVVVERDFEYSSAGQATMITAVDSPRQGQGLLLVLVLFALIFYVIRGDTDHCT